MVEDRTQEAIDDKKVVICALLIGTGIDNFE